MTEERDARISPKPQPDKVRESRSSVSRRSRVASWALKRLGADPAPPPADVSGGRQPTSRQTFLWDLAPHDVAPRADGVILPAWSDHGWIDHLPRRKVTAALEIQRRVAEGRLVSIAAIEQKASRLLTPFVALLAGALALTGFQLAAVDFDHPVSAWFAVFGAAFGVAGSVWILQGMIRALDADTRMSISVSPTVEQEVRAPRMALLNEARAAEAAAFSQRMKAERILFARAAISRGLTMLVVSTVLGGVVLLTSPDSDESAPQSPYVPTPAPSSTSSTTPTPTLTPTASVRSQPTTPPSPTTAPSQSPK